MAERMLLRAGYEPARIAEILKQLPDPIDTDRDGPALVRLGLTLDELISELGGSP